MFSRRSFVFVGVGLAGACAHHAWAQQVAEGADGEPITESDIRNRLRLLEVKTRRAPSREAVIEDLRNDRRILQEAKRRGIEITDADVDEAQAQEAARWGATVQLMNDAYARAGLDLGDFRQALRVALARMALGLPP